MGRGREGVCARKMGEERGGDARQVSEGVCEGRVYSV